MTTTLIVERSRKDAAGNVIAICGAGFTHDAATAITNIRSQAFQYRVLRTDGPHVRPYGTHFLTSDPDSKTGNNLQSLPAC